MRVFPQAFIFLLALLGCGGDDSALDDAAVADASTDLTDAETPMTDSAGDGADGSDGSDSQAPNCEPATVTPGPTMATLSFGAADRQYLLYIPTSLVQPAALVLAFHGGGGAGSIGLLQGTGLRAKADEEGFVLVAPSGIGGFWSAGSCCGPQAVDDVGFVRAVIDDVASRVCLDPRRVFATGHSNGGMMAYRLACELSDRIAAVAPSAGYLVNINNGRQGAPVEPPTTIYECLPTRPVPVLTVHGTGDTCAPIEGGPVTCGGTLLRPPVAHGVDIFRDRNGCTGEGTVSFENGAARCLSYAPCREGSDVVYCTVENGGHTWFGNLGMTNPEEFGGVYSDDLIMQNAAWDFFASHPMAQPGGTR
ncbi:MAG: hydrolase [Myxococcota bacterium]